VKEIQRNVKGEREATRGRSRLARHRQRSERSANFCGTSNKQRHFSILLCTRAGENPVRSIPAIVANRSLGVLLHDAVLGADKAGSALVLDLDWEPAGGELRPPVLHRHRQIGRDLARVRSRCVHSRKSAFGIRRHDGHPHVRGSGEPRNRSVHRDDYRHSLPGWRLMQRLS
jgi:hypothetical protein